MATDTEILRLQARLLKRGARVERPLCSVHGAQLVFGCEECTSNAKLWRCKCPSWVSLGDRCPVCGENWVEAKARELREERSKIRPLQKLAKGGDLFPTPPKKAA